MVLQGWYQGGRHIWAQQHSGFSPPNKTGMATIPRRMLIPHMETWAWPLLGNHSNTEIQQVLDGRINQKNCGESLGIFGQMRMRNSITQWRLEVRFWRLVSTYRYRLHMTQAAATYQKWDMLHFLHLYSYCSNHYHEATMARLHCHSQVTPLMAATNNSGPTHWGMQLHANLGYPWIWIHSNSTFRS